VENSLAARASGLADAEDLRSRYTAASKSEDSGLDLLAGWGFGVAFRRLNQGPANSALGPPEKTQTLDPIPVN
jgi:hypothetical protein